MTNSIAIFRRVLAIPALWHRFHGGIRESVWIPSEEKLHFLQNYINIMNCKQNSITMNFWSNLSNPFKSDFCLIRTKFLSAFESDLSAVSCNCNMAQKIAFQEHLYEVWIWLLSIIPLFTIWFKDLNECYDF